MEGSSKGKFWGQRLRLEASEQNNADGTRDRERGSWTGHNWTRASGQRTEDRAAWDRGQGTGVMGQVTGRT